MYIYIFTELPLGRRRATFPRPSPNGGVNKSVTERPHRMCIYIYIYIYREREKERNIIIIIIIIIININGPYPF